MNSLLWVAALLWLLYSLAALRDLSAIKPLPALGSAGDSATPSVSVVVPTRDEGPRLEETLRHFLNQQQIELELIVVDDRSVDDTRALLQRLSREDNRLRPLFVDALPDGWLGKTHACHLGAELARGDWILFADADTAVKTDVVRRAVDTANRDGVEHLTLFPDEEKSTVFGHAAIIPFGMLMLGHAARANRDHRFGFFGVGAFNLLQRKVYDGFGGHTPLRYEVVDDMKLGMLVRRAGFRTRVYRAHDAVTVRWADSARSMVQALLKNSFAMADYSIPLNVLLILGCGSLWLAGLLGWIHGSPAGYSATAAFLSSLLPATLISVGMGWGLRPVLLSPFLIGVLLWAMTFSMWQTLRDGGVRWRDTLYPLERLRSEGLPLLLRRRRSR